MAAQQQYSNDVRAIEFPDTADYQTLTVDLHTHSVFSDGHVWPKIRVEEALRDQLDALAITEHLEYQPHRADILHPDRNRAYDIAADAAKNSDLIVSLAARSHGMHRQVTSTRCLLTTPINSSK